MTLQEERKTQTTIDNNIDLIHASAMEAAGNAQQPLEGEFSHFEITYSLGSNPDNQRYIQESVSANPDMAINRFFDAKSLNSRIFETIAVMRNPGFEGTSHEFTKRSIVYQDKIRGISLLNGKIIDNGEPLVEGMLSTLASYSGMEKKDVA